MLSGIGPIAQKKVILTGCFAHFLLPGNLPLMRPPPASFKIGIGIGIGIGIENNRWTKTMELTPRPIGSGGKYQNRKIMREKPIPIPIPIPIPN
jgi:hypothetical protein